MRFITIKKKGIHSFKENINSTAFKAGIRPKKTIFIDMPMTCRSPWLLPNRLRSLLIIALHDFIYWPRSRPPVHKKEDTILMKHTTSLQSGPFVRHLNHITPINYKVRANRATRPPWPCIAILWTTNGLIPPWMIHTPYSQKVATIDLNKFHGYTPRVQTTPLEAKTIKWSRKTMRTAI